MKILFFFILISISIPSYATVCNSHPWFTEINYHPIIAIVGIIGCFLGAILLIKLFFNRKKEGSVSIIFSLCVSLFLILIPLKLYYDLSQDFGFTHSEFFQFNGRVDSCRNFTKWMP
jgi:hypothetical protein